MTSAVSCSDSSSGGGAWIGQYMQTNAASHSFRMMVERKCVFTVEFPPRIWEVIKSYFVDYQKVWALQLRCQRTLSGHTAIIWAVAITSDNLIVTASLDHTAKVWNLDGECLQTLTGHTNDISAVAITSDNLIVTASGDHTAKVWGVQR